MTSTTLSKTLHKTFTLLPTLGLWACLPELPSDKLDGCRAYADLDQDGFGDPASALVVDCPLTGPVSENDLDCDDAVAAVNPDAVELCDEIDNDCDGEIDDDAALEWTLDDDGDGFGDDTTAVITCTPPGGSSWVNQGGDCDDDDPTVNPGEAIGCDGVDNNCDGAIDNDLDGDGASDEACGGTDCDDGDAAIVPEANGDCALGGTCNEILLSGRGASDADYLIDPDGPGQGLPPFLVPCDMSGGGWTLVEYAADLPFDDHHTDGDGWQWLAADFTLTLSDAQIDAIRARSLEAEQRYVGLCDDVLHYYDDWAEAYTNAFGFRLHDGGETPYGSQLYTPYNIQVVTDGCQFNGDEGGLESNATIFAIEDLGVPVVNVLCYDCGTAIKNERFGSPLTKYPAKFR
ncbi:MAG: hypothetical protein IPO67_20910 [Deltaproteobacteria bacterium]|nr:hypothetical protein [Deltaproteobacteria bacterium]